VSNIKADIGLSSYYTCNPPVGKTQDVNATGFPGFSLNMSGSLTGER